MRDFDYYNPDSLEIFGQVHSLDHDAVLGIAAGIIGRDEFRLRRLSRVDTFQQHERREGRPYEYQYRFIRITDLDDPIFKGIQDEETGVWQDYTTEASILRVWQNHGLQLDRIPEGFKLLATAYLCRNQMMVKRTDGQLIYTVQFHLEKSFEDWDKRRATRWEHPNKSRDGRIIFENFLNESLKLRQK